MSLNRRSFLRAAGLATAWLAGRRLLRAAPTVRAESGRVLRFVQITDTHFGDTGHYDRTADIVNRINHLPFDIRCVVHTGDIFSDSILRDNVVRRGQAILKKIKPPTYYLPGNHDILRKRGETTLRATAEAYGKHFGPLNHKAEHDGVLFLFAYTEPLAKGFDLPGCDTLEWLEKELQTAGDKPVLLFHHRPSCEDFYNNKVHPGWPTKIRNRWVELVGSANVRGVITGHFHRDEYHWLGHVPLFVAGPVAGFWGRQGTYRVWQYDHGTGRLTYNTEYLNG